MKYSTKSEPNFKYNWKFLWDKFISNHNQLISLLINYHFKAKIPIKTKFGSAGVHCQWDYTDLWQMNTHFSFILDDGLVSEEEFLGWMASQEEIGGQEDDIMEDLLAAFRVFDKDGNGYITKVSISVDINESKIAI